MQGRKAEQTKGKEAMGTMQGVQALELVDGYGRERAVMIKASPLEGGGCAPGKHCAHHGDYEEGFTCCRCGATFCAERDYRDFVKRAK